MRPLSAEPGPSGWRHDAPGVHVHHWSMWRRSTGPGVPVKTSDPARRFSGGASGKSAGSGARSATVTCPVARVNAAKRRLVTGARSIQNALVTATGRAGASSA